jgi:hypothetical protein
MAPLEREEYLRLKEFLGAWDVKFLRHESPSLAEEHRPVAALERAEKASKAQASAGLLMAVNDIVEMSLHWPLTKIAQIDHELEASGIISLSQVRARYTRRLSRIILRGSIRNEVEYYLAKGILDGAPAVLDDAAQIKLEQLVTMYEERTVARSPPPPTR